MATMNEQVKNAIDAMTTRAMELGADADDKQGIVRAIVTEHGLGFNAWFCVCCEIAERKAKAAGFKSEVDRAFKAAVENLRIKNAGDVK